MTQTSTAVPLDATVLPSNKTKPLPVNATRHYEVPPRSSSVRAVGSDVIKALRSQGFTVGLAESMADVRDFFPLRIWVVDNSGSMISADGHRIIITNSQKSVGNRKGSASSSTNTIRIVDCTRWDEIKEAVSYHIQLSAQLEAPTTFRLLNQPGFYAGPHTGMSQFDIALTGSDTETIHNEVIAATDIMTRVRPGGATPLTKHINDIHDIVSSMKDALEDEGRRVAVILATDGLPTDNCGTSGWSAREAFVRSLKLLQGLPVWLVIRLCTDEDEVVEFYNTLDDELELSMDVLDDFVGEAREVYSHNAWLNYALPLHRMREMGYHDRLFDMLDERALTRGEVGDFCRLLFGARHFDGVADPSEDWGGFRSSVERLLQCEDLQYNPISKKMMPWIDLKKLDRMYNAAGVGKNNSVGVGSTSQCCTVM